MMAEVKFDVLGAEYTLLITSESMEPRLAGISGFCDKTTRRIVVACHSARHEALSRKHKLTIGKQSTRCLDAYNNGVAYEICRQAKLEM